MIWIAVNRNWSDLYDLKHGRISPLEISPNARPPHTPLNPNTYLKLDNEEQPVQSVTSSNEFIANQQKADSSKTDEANLVVAAERGHYLSSQFAFD